MGTNQSTRCDDCSRAAQRHAFAEQTQRHAFAEQTRRHAASDHGADARGDSAPREQPAHGYPGSRRAPSLNDAPTPAANGYAEAFGDVEAGASKRHAHAEELSPRAFGRRLPGLPRKHRPSC